MRLHTVELPRHGPGLFFMGARPFDEAIPKARQAATKALRLDDSSAEAHHAMAVVYYHEWNWKAAEDENDKAISVNPGYSTSYVLSTNICRHLGRADESIVAAKKGLQVDPLAMITNQMLGNAYVNARKYDLAIVQYQKALELHPNNSTLLYHLGWAYVYTRAYDKGIEAIENSLALEGGDPQTVAGPGIHQWPDRQERRNQANPAAECWISPERTRFIRA